MLVDGIEVDIEMLRVILWRMRLMSDVVIPSADQNPCAEQKVGNGKQCSNPPVGQQRFQPTG